MTYTVKDCDLSCYGGYVPPSLDCTIIQTPCLLPELAQMICERVDAGKVYESEVHNPTAGSAVEHYHRSSRGVWVDHATYEWVKFNITSIVVNQVPEHLVGGRGMPQLAEQIQFLKYEEAMLGKFRRHWDDGYHEAGQFRFTSPHRKITAILILNEGYEGGELVLDTVLDEQGRPFIVKPPAGTLIIFPSDQRYPHEVKPVVKGIRRSVVAWFDLV